MRATTTLSSILVSCLVVSLGADTIKVWDLLSRAPRPLHAFANHAKTVTALATDPEGGRLLSASLDGHVKIYDVQVRNKRQTHKKQIRGHVLIIYIHLDLCVRACLLTPDPPPTHTQCNKTDHTSWTQSYDVVHSLRFTGPLLSVGLSPNKARLMVGKADGTLAVRVRKAAAKEMAAAGSDYRAGGGLSASTRKPIFGGTTRHFQRGKNAVAGAGDFTVELHRRQRLAPYDEALKGFKYHAALDAALEQRNPRTIVAVLEELIMRRVRESLGGWMGVAWGGEECGCPSPPCVSHTRTPPTLKSNNVDTYL